MNNALVSPSPMPYMPAPKAAGSANTKPAGDNRGELNEISVQPTENGFEVTCSYDPKKVNPKLARYDQMPEDTKMSFESPESAIAYVTKQMGGASDAEASEGPGDSDDDEAGY
jgi:hypothetical protein